MLDPGDQVRAGRVRHELQGAPIGSQSAGVVGRVEQVVPALAVPHDAARVRVEVLGIDAPGGERLPPVLVVDEVGRRHEVPGSPGLGLAATLVEVVEPELVAVRIGDDVPDPVRARPEEDFLRHDTPL